ncbi:MAG: amidohydrolase family protein [Gemmatimonadetes bacterium]|nr:amidohydrolase family protein [Gemmatimonadota bacterium]
MFDLLITGGTVVDGTGRPGFRADVGVEDREIAAIGDLSAATAARIIDARGLTVTPGFIDTHTHADGMLLVDPQHECGIRQGVTTEIISPDGLSYPPLSPVDYRMYRRYMAGILGLPPEDADMSSMEAARANYHRRTACNVAAFVGHGPVRIGAVGFRDAPLRGEALDVAKRLVRESLEQGAVGLSTGLSYYPHSYSDTEEIVELCRVVAECGGVLSIHLRNHNTDRGFGGGGVAEALEIARRSRVKLHYEHFRTSPATAGHVDALVADIDRAKAEGLDITLECYPYPAGSSFPMAFFPGPFHDGGPEAIVRRLTDPAEKARYLRWFQGTPIRPLAGQRWTWIGPESHRRLQGMTWEDAARDRGVAIEEMVWDVMRETNLECGFLESPPQSTRIWRQQEADQAQLLARDDYMVGSDAIPLDGMVHPRAWGTFPRFVGRLRRRHGCPLERVIQRVTQNPARRFGLKGRGVLAVGNCADVVVFDAATICDLATYEDPQVPPAGIPYVVVNGRVAVDRGRLTGVLAGEAVP